MASLFPRNFFCCCYKKALVSIFPPVKPRFFSSATFLEQWGPPPKIDRRRFKTAGATVLSGILAGVYYKYIFDGSDSRSLNPITFTPYTLTSKTPIASSSTQTTIFTLSPPKSSTSSPILPFATGILSIQIKQPQLQIARSYTPLPPGTNDDLRFFIKKEPGGEMSRYLYSLNEGDVIEIRGPEVEYAYPSLENKKVLFFAGGTGIAPALQVVGSLLLQVEGGRGREAEILWAVRDEEETLGAMSEEIDKLMSKVKAAGNKLTIRKFVDSEGRIKIQDVVTAIISEDGKSGSRVFVSGPEGFIAWIAGPKDLRSGREEQGVLGGMLKVASDKTGSKFEVFKL